MTKARDLSNLISTGVPNSLINLDANEIPNLDASKITSGSIADARIPASAVSQHATSFDDNDIVNDLSTIALRSATTENAIAYNTNSSFVDVFQDSSGIASHTNAPRNTSEYVSSTSNDVGVTSSAIFFVDGNNTSAPFTDLKNNMTGTTNDIGGTSGTPTYNTSNQKWSGYNVLDLNGGTINYGTQHTSYWNGTGDYTIECWFKNKGTMASRNRYWCFGTDNTNGLMSYGVDYGSPSDFNSYAGDVDYNPSGTFTHANNDTAWRHFRYVRSGSDSLFYFDGTKIGTISGGNMTATMNQKFRINGRPNNSNDGTEFFDAYYTDFIISNSALSTGASYTLPSAKAVIGSTSATGNFISNTITAPTSTSSMGAIITYQDQAGTNALNTDIILELSADNGSNFSVATLSALPNFSTGIKMAKVNDLAVTAGTQLKYRLSFANQASGSKEARIRGVSLQY
jgi:hypothetical protein